MIIANARDLFCFAHLRTRAGHEEQGVGRGCGDAPMLSTKMVLTEFPA